ncbi:MAG: lipid-binding SYLF domain-containing protein [Nitrospirae bacterium]|jgi:lipid-binding SYLF domain-containing protein|nr:lipid-binding SYLF domain-containing protein [Nitrospirota bacterium]
MMTTRLIKALTLSLALLLILTVGHPIASASEEAEQKDLVEKSRMTLDGFETDSNMAWFRDHIKDAKGIFIVPQLLKAAFFFGGEGGTGVFLVKDDKTGEWSEPAFYTMGAGSFGFQFGAQASEVVLLVMSQRGVESLLSSTFKLGGGVSVAVGPVGAGIEGSTAMNLSADLLSFARAKGLFGGISLEGAVIATRDEWNRNYYGKDVRPTDILVKRAVTNPHSANLRAALARTVAGKSSPGQTATPTPN